MNMSPENAQRLYGFFFFFVAAGLLGWLLSAFATGARSFGKAKRIDQSSGELTTEPIPFAFLLIVMTAGFGVAVVGATTAHTLSQRAGALSGCALAVLIGVVIFFYMKMTIFKWTDGEIIRPGTLQQIAWNKIESLDFRGKTPVAARGPNASFVSWGDCSGRHLFIEQIARKRPDLLR